MAAVISPESLEDPIGVIAGLVARRDPAMDREVIMKVAESVAGGRAKRRQLAQAQPAHRTDAGNFARWACKHKLTT